MLKSLATATAISALMMTGAFAQTNPTPAPAPTPPAAATPAPSGAGGSAMVVPSQKPDQWLFSQFKGTDVMGTDDKKVGDVSDVLMDREGKVIALVVSFGGFLGMGTKDIALEPKAFTVTAGDSPSDAKLKVSMTQEELKNMAAFEPYKAPVRDTVGSANRPATPAAPRQ